MRTTPCRTLGRVQSRELVIRTIRYAVITMSIAIGLGLVSIAAVLGDCAAFGGRCPVDPPPLRRDGVFQLAASGTFLAVAVPIVAWRPTWRRLGVALGVGVVAALAIGLTVRTGAHS